MAAAFTRDLSSVAALCSAIAIRADLTADSTAIPTSMA
jgi:hypothetical protein